MTWTAADVPDRTGRTIVVTGANSGLGFEATKSLCDAGAHVVMACRSTDRGERARADVERAVRDASVEVMALDLADLSSVESFAAAFADEYDELHALLNNAGVMAIPRRETADGFEMQFGTNHLGHFALTGRLLDVLRDTEGETRVVTQSSSVHERGRIDFDDLHGDDGYRKWGAYAQSKLANVLFAYELDRRLDAADADVVSNACHPGYTATNLQTTGPELEGSRLKAFGARVANAVFAQGASVGALPMLYAATAPAAEGGSYYGPGGLFDMRGYPSEQESSSRSYDREAARRLWRVSEDLTGVSYDLPATEATEPA